MEIIEGLKVFTPEELVEILAEHKKWLEDNNTGRRADLSSADLRSADLSSADLRYADLSSADLRSADLSSADLRYANFSCAVLRYANFSCADFSYAVLRYADLIHANFSRANFSGADFSGADLDFSVWPLWCGSLEAKIDKRQFLQLLYHTIRAGQSVDDKEVKKILSMKSLINVANKSHVVTEHHQKLIIPLEIKTEKIKANKKEGKK